MEICSNSICNNPAEVEKLVEAPFSMTSTAADSRRVIMICTACAEQEKRLKTLG